MNLMMIMPNLALIGAQKMGLNFLENINHIVKNKQLVILSDNRDDLKNLHHNIPNYIQLKQNTKGVKSKIETIKSIYRLRKIIKKQKPDVVVSIAPIMDIFLILSTIGLKQKPKIVIEEHQHLTHSFKYDKDSHHWFMKLFYNYFIFLYNRADSIKVVSQDSKEDFIENWGLDKDKFFVLNPPINITQLKELVFQDLPEYINKFISKDSNIVFSLGRLENQKNFLLLIESFYKAYKNDESLKLIIVGKGSQKKKLLKKIKELNIEKNVLLAGFVENPYPLFHIAKVFCLTSIWEGMPVTIMESMALGCPVISVNCKSGPSEMIQNQENGILVENNIDDISDAINLLINDKKLWKKIKINSQENAKKWDIFIYTDIFLKYLINLIGDKK